MFLFAEVACANLVLGCLGVDSATRTVADILAMLLCELHPEACHRHLLSCGWRMFPTTRTSGMNVQKLSASHPQARDPEPLSISSLFWRDLLKHFEGWRAAIAFQFEQPTGGWMLAKVGI